MGPPLHINGFRVIEYGYFLGPRLPIAYLMPPDGQAPLELVQNLAICTADNVDGYYLLFCTPDWRYVTFCFNESLEFTKRSPAIEFGQEVTMWHQVA
jgi:hypothetical protein